MISLAWVGDWPITQFFGEHPQKYAWLGMDGHNGLDVATPIGTVVRALWDADLVESAYDEGGYGHYVKLRTPSGVDVLFAHLRDAVGWGGGTRIPAGTPFGETGSSGWSSGPHLHLAIRPDFRYRGGGFLGYVDPLPWALAP